MRKISFKFAFYVLSFTIVLRSVRSQRGERGSGNNNQVDCSSGGLKRNPESCTSFFMCTHGRPVLTQCGAGTEFNEALQVCDHPQNANCRVSSNGYSNGQSNGVYGNQSGGYGNSNGGYGSQNGGYGSSNGGYGSQNGGYGNSDGGYENSNGGYTSNRPSGGRQDGNDQGRQDGSNGVGSASNNKPNSGSGKEIYPDMIFVDF